MPDTIEKVIEEFMLRYMAGRAGATVYRGNSSPPLKARFTTLAGRIINHPARRNPAFEFNLDRGNPMTANRTLAAVRKLVNWALQRHYRSNPSRWLRSWAQRKRERPAPRRKSGPFGRRPTRLGYPSAHSSRWRSPQGSGARKLPR